MNETGGAPPRPAERQPEAAAPPPDRRRLRRALLAGYAAVFCASVALFGFPLNRDELMVWLAGLMLVATLGRGAGTGRRLVRDWLPFALVLVLYDLSRGLATKIGMPLHITPQIHVDRFLGMGTLPTVWLQDHLLLVHPVRFGLTGLPVVRPISWWEVLPGLVYASHFVVSYVVAAWLWVRDRERWLGFTCRFVTLSFAGVFTYILFPAAPPWWASQHGYLPPIIQGVSRGWDKIGLHGAGSLLHDGKMAFNPVAAIPSLHVAFATLVALYLWPKAGRLARAILAVYPLAMAFTLILEGEHYVVDVLLGYAYAVGVMVLWRYVDPRLRAWRRRRFGSPALSPA